MTLKADKRRYLIKLWLLLALMVVSAFWFYPAGAAPPLPYKPEAGPASTITPAPLPTSDGQVRSVEVPIIMYHHIAAPPPDADAIRRDLSVSPQALEEQLRYLVEAGYHPITLRQLVMHLQSGQPLPEKPVILTFDDGYRDNYTHAYPLLKEYGFVATFFIVSGPIDFGDKEYMTWEQIELMSAEGMDIEDHSYSHPDLAGQPQDFITRQILAPQEAIEAHSGQEVRFFCYPAGSYDQTVIEVLKAAHFWGAVSTKAGVWHSSEHPFELKRLRVHSDYSLAQFVALLNMEW